MVEDIYDIWEPAWWQSPWIIVWGILCFVILLLIIVLYTRYKARRKKSEISSIEQVYQRFVILLAAEQVKQKEIYQCITILMRYVFEKEYGCALMHYTDDEIIEYLNHHKRDTLIVSDIVPLLQRGSLVKFAGAQVCNEDLYKDADLAHRLYEKYPLDTSGKLRDTKKRQRQA